MQAFDHSTFCMRMDFVSTTRLFFSIAFVYSFVNTFHNKLNFLFEQIYLRRLNLILCIIKFCPQNKPTDAVKIILITFKKRKCIALAMLNHSYDIIVAKFFFSTAKTFLT